MIRLGYKLGLRFIATLGPLGRLPAPGTWGSLVGLIGGWVLAPYGLGVMVLAAAALIGVGIMAATSYSEQTGTHDASEIIIDEVAGQFLTLLFILPSLRGGAAEILFYLLGFALFRLFDISKWGLVGRAERLEKGVGIMADDLVAGVLAGLVLLALQIIIRLMGGV